MKKIWLRKEREDSKSQLESKVMTQVDDPTSEKNENDISVPNVEATPKVASEQNVVRAESRIEPGNHEIMEDRSSKVTHNCLTASLIPENGYSFYHPMDASHVHPAYILAIRPNELPSMVQGAINPYQLNHQIQFAVPNAISFLPVAQVKKYDANENNYGMFYDSYSIKSAKEDRKYFSQSGNDDLRYSNHSSAAQNGLSNPGSLSKHSKLDYSQHFYSNFHQGKKFIHNFLDRNSTHLSEGRYRTLPQSKSPTLTIRKRAPNSPLAVPITPTTTLGQGTVFSRAFVVPRNMMKLSDAKENTDNVKNCDPSAALLPSMITDMTELEVRDSEREMTHKIKSRDPHIRDFQPASKNIQQPHSNNVLNFRPYETTVLSIGGGCPAAEIENHGTSNKSNQIHDNSIATNTNEMRTTTNHKHHNKDDDNNRNKDTRLLIPPITLKDKETTNVAVPTTDDTSSKGNPAAKEHAIPMLSSASRGKGRPAKGVGKGGAEPSSMGPGLRSVIKCQTCMKVFNNSSALAKHKLTHSDERKYSCHLCSKAFKRQDHLNGHMMTHSSKKPFECRFPGCAKSYCDARSLRRHLENHHHDSINSCAGSSAYAAPAVDGCHGNGPMRQLTDSTATTQYIDDHWNAKVVWAPGFNPLDEPKPVRCHVCGRCFKNVPALNGHMRLHGGYINRDIDDDGTKHPGQNDSDVSVAMMEPLKRMLWDSKTTKSFDGKTRYRHDDDDVTYGRALSLECLTSHPMSTMPWDSMRDELERIKSKSCSLPRDELKRGGDSSWVKVDRMAIYKDGGSTRSEFDRYGHVTHDVNYVSYKSMSSGIIDLTTDEKLQGKNKHEGLYNQKVESSVQMEKMNGNISSLEMERVHSSKFSNIFQIMPSNVTNPRCFKNISDDILNVSHMKLESNEKSAEILPKHFQASSLYQRRLRRFSERSPNSDESSRQSGTPPPRETEIKGNNFDKYRPTSHKFEEKKKMFATPVLSGRNLEENAKPLDSKTLTEAANSTTNLSRQGNEKVHPSHPSSTITHRPHSDQTKTQPVSITITSSDFGPKPSGSLTNIQASSIHLTPNENPNISLLHQSHSSLPCTPYTAHTPYTPRTTEPMSPQQASFFQFPPSLQPEGSKVPSMEAPSMSAFNPEHLMETARIPDDTYTMIVRRQGGDGKTFTCKRDHPDQSNNYQESSSSDESSHWSHLKTRGQTLEQRTTQIKSESKTSQEKEKLSTRRKVKPAPLVLPSQKEIKERFDRSQKDHDTDDTIMSSCSFNRSPPRNLSPAPLEFRTALKSSVSSLDSGYPKSSARSILESRCLNSSEMFKYADESNNRNYNIDAGHPRHKADVNSEPRKDFLPKKSIVVGPEFQASIPRFDVNKCGQKEKAELWLPNKDWPDATKGLCWSETEIQQFSRAVYNANKDFSAISKMVGSRSMKECIQFYYTWKKKHHGDYRRHKTMRRSFGGGGRVIWGILVAVI